MTLTTTQHIGLKIRQRRKEMRLTQQDLADYVGLTRTSLVNLERGRSRTTFDTLWEICNALSCTPNDLFPSQKKVRTRKITKTVLRMVPIKVEVTKQKLPKRKVQTV